MWLGVIQVFFSWKFDPHPPPRNANNVEPYTFVTLFSGKADTPPTPTALRNTWMGPYITTMLWNALLNKLAIMDTSLLWLFHLPIHIIRYLSLIF